MWNRVKRWWAAEGALVGLQGMNDRMLQDMGLEREGLRALVMGQRADHPETPATCACPVSGRLARS
ncbi:hypothetical protein [Tabrizicola sp.]|uniref:hypothetical protein n=1 Tax=Tabrizicola sp. TaxID=2005166 RepID=UPI002734D9D0|nr:hypothetical protein [Tabrizicola sp.]MDP3196051.1 hypothetical protein [Tabrizicola sp.]